MSAATVTTGGAGAVEVQPDDCANATDPPATPSDTFPAGDGTPETTRRNRAPSSSAPPRRRSMKARGGPTFAVPHVAPPHYHRTLVNAFVNLIVADLKTWPDPKEPQ